jgi:hypothetical protein
MRQKINLQEIFSENLIQNKSDENQIKRINDKINLLLEIRKNKTNSNMKKFEDITKIEKIENKNNFIFSFGLSNLNIKLFYEEIVKKNFFVFSLCYGSYLFSKFSRFVISVDHINNYRKLFTFSFCFLPFGIILYFSKMDFDLKQIEYKLKGYKYE